MRHAVRQVTPHALSRSALRAHFASAVLPLFDGTVKYINHQVDEQVAAR